MKFSFKNFFKKNSQKLILNKNKYKTTHNFERDWALLLLFFLLLLFIISFVAYREYASFILRPTENIEIEKQTTIDEKKLEEIIKDINEREATFKHYTATSTTLIDPSL